ncbi:MAG: DUF763 domain-containing protein [Candidatus Hadarchaeales archaeon]
MRTGIAELPLHGGRCPPWLFARMKLLGGAISEAIVNEHGRKELIRRLADPFFFQALGCVLGFDWHSSGLTTTVCGALKEAIEPEDLGISVCGGKGSTSRRTPEEIERAGDVFSLSSPTIDRLKHASRMVAKVDNACVQDGYQLYHHTFFVTEDGDWAVVQQGMHERLARRYHWLSEGLRSFVEEPHSGIAGERKEGVVLDMTAMESDDARKVSVDLVKEGPKRIVPLLREADQRSLDEYLEMNPPVAKLVMPVDHLIKEVSKDTLIALQRAHELQPENYEELISIRGIGPKAVRALALVSALIYGRPPSWKDPVKFSFAHGGKDGVPYPVDRRTYQETINMLEGALQSARVGRREKLDAIKRLHVIVG